MPRTSGITIQNNFSQGLITESTPLNFPKNASTDADNVIFDYTGRVSRRQEIDLEDGYSLGSSLTFTGNDVYTEYHWQQASDKGFFAFMVQQAGDTIHFFDTSSTTTLSPGKNANTITLSTYTANGSTVVPGSWPCQYAQGNGALLVVNRGIDPILIKYDPATDTFTTTALTLQFRDFSGLVDPYSDATRPAFATVTDMKADADGIIHYYNLLNQGWWQGTISGGELSSTSALGQWDADATSGSPAVGTMPSNYDYVGYYRASATDPYDPNILINFQQGNSPAPKGHFILNVGDTDRKQAVIDSGITLDLNGVVVEIIPYTSGTIIGNLNLNTTQAFDNNYNPSSSLAQKKDASPGNNTTVTGWLGKDLGSGNAKKIDHATWYGNRLLLGSYGAATYKNVGIGGGGFPQTTFVDPDVTIQLYGSNTSPSTETSGTKIGQATYKAGANTHVTISSTDKTNTYRYIWLRALYTTRNNGTNSAGEIDCSEMEFWEAKTVTNTATYDDRETTTERPQAVAYYAGRAFYGALNSDEFATSIFFSQIIEKDAQYGYCYQLNDPTSEDFFDLLDSDGGVIKIPEMGQLQTLFVYQTALIAMASNGTWIIRGSQGNGFKATDYVVRKISSQGTTAPNSVVDVNGIPYWWGESSIMRLNYNPQFDSFSVESITDTTIRSFFLNIPMTQRSLVKGDYDQYQQFAYWLYGDATAVTPSYNHVLVYNARTQALFPFSTTVGASSPEIVGIKFIEDILGQTVPQLKLTTTINIDSTHQYLTYSSISHATPHYIDWYNYSNDIVGDDTQEQDYLSYFVTNYELDGDTQRFVQPNYVMLFLDQPYDENGDRIEQSAFLRGVFDFAISGDTGKWSSTAQSSQQIFNDNLPNRSINLRRLKIRGKGRALQFRVSSETGKPFSIVGWSVWKTANSQD